jgi:hypothetical protein
VCVVYVIVFWSLAYIKIIFFTSSSPKSDICFDFSNQGFQTTRKSNIYINELIFIKSERQYGGRSYGKIVTKTQERKRSINNSCTCIRKILLCNSDVMISSEQLEFVGCLFVNTISNESEQLALHRNFQVHNDLLSKFQKLVYLSTFVEI